MKILYCVPKYPANISDYKLEKLGLFDGVSDHTISLDLAKIVLARNPNAIIEKHFCLDHKTGIDAKWSMTPMELFELRRWADICDKVL